MTFLCLFCGFKHATLRGLYGHKRWCQCPHQRSITAPSEYSPVESTPQESNTDEVSGEEEREIYELSSQQGTLLIKVLKSKFREEVISEIPKSYEVMKDKVELIFTRIFEVYPVGILIPEDFSSSQTTIYEGHHVNVMTMLADMLLQVDIKDLHVKPFRIRDNEGTRVLREPSSGMDFKEMYEYTTRTYGPDVIPLLVTVALDELALNKVGSREAKPLYIQISSMHADKYWDESNIRCIGFSPATLVGIYVISVCH